VRLGGARYLNAVEIGPDASPVVALVRYEVAGDELSLALLDYDAAKEAVRAGRLSGRFTRGDDGGDLLLTGANEELERFLLAEGPEALFTKLAPSARRVGDGSARTSRRGAVAGSRRSRTPAVARAEHTETEQPRAQ
jgi:hypothetical protein